MTSHDAVRRLEVAAVAWVGTPFCAGAAAIGQGVCCHRFVAEVYFSAGWLPRIELPSGSPRWARGSMRSLIEEWLDGPGAKYFSATDAAGTAWDAGDLLGFRVGRCLHHLAIALGPDRIAHVVEGHGVAILDGLPDAWASRLVRRWRPIPIS